MVTILDPILPPDDLTVAPQQLSTQWAVTVPPTARLVTPNQLRSHARLDYDVAGVAGDSDENLGLMIDAATAYAEGRLNAVLMPRTIRAVFYAGERLDLPIGPVIQVLSVASQLAAGETTIVTSPFTFQNYGWTVRVLPTGLLRYPILVDYTAGYQAIGSAAPAVPADIRLAILMHAASLYLNRESISDKAMLPVPHSLDAFYDRKSRQTGVA